MNRSICPMLWHHTHVRPNGKIYPCCHFQTKDLPEDLHLSNKNFLNHSYLESIRTKMKAGELVPGCFKCYSDEKANNNSVRLEFLEHYKNYTGKEFSPPSEPFLTYIDISFSNLCNNKCRICTPDLSTHWYPDAKKLNIPIQSGVVYNSDFLENIDFSRMLHMRIAGGEPLLEQEKFCSLLKKCDRSKLSLHIYTNGSTLPSDTLIDLLNECRSVMWFVSIDAYGKLNDFLRKGSDWNVITKNLKWFQENFSNVAISSVINIYNINCLDTLPDFIQQEFPKFNFYYVADVGGNTNTEIYNLPTPVKLVLHDKINRFKNPHVIKVKKLIIKNLFIIEGNFQDFLNRDNKLNEIRNEHWKYCNPELYELLLPYMDNTKSEVILDANT